MKRFLKYVGGLLSITAMIFAFSAVNPLKADADIDKTPDCDTYAVIRCGADSPGQLRTEYDSFNASGANGSTVRQDDIHKIFTALGVSRAELNGTVGNEFKMGTVYQNGDVVVGGKVVAKNAKMAARNLGGTAIAGTNAGVMSVSKMGSAQEAMVKFNNGRFVMAVMTPCGNPVSATPVEQPSAKCEGLDKNKISRNEFSFVGHASAVHGAEIKSYTFTARNAAGKVVATKTVKTNNNQANSGKMTFDKPGDYKIRLTVNTTVGEKTDEHCVVDINVNPEPKPAISIEKKVMDKNEVAQENVLVGVNQTFTYRMVVKNTGNVDLRDAVVTDKQPAGVTFISASAGTIANGEWKYTIPELKVGESKTFMLKAKIPTYLAGSIKNTVCVNTPTIPGSPDDCDDAHVHVPTPSATCDLARTNYNSSNRNQFTLSGKASTFNGATVSSYNFTIKNAAGAVVQAPVVTSTALTATTPQLTLETPGTYTVNLVVKTSLGDRTSTACNTTVVIPTPNMVPVCDPATGLIITVPEDQAGNYKPVDDPACQPKPPVQIEVCELSSKNIITINEVDFNATLHSKNLADCDEGTVQVCDEETGEIITVPASEAGNYKDKNDAACKEATPEVLVDTGAGDILGIFASVTAAGAIAHRLVWTRRRV